MAKGSFKEKNDRHNAILSCLRSQEFWRAEDLCTRLAISYRTLMRDLAELREAGAPIESDRGRGGGISLRGRWGLSKITLDNSEVISLLVSLAIAESIQSPLMLKNLKSIRHRISSAFPTEQRKTIANIRNRIYVGSVASENVLANYEEPKQRYLDLLNESFLNNRKVSIEYRSGAEETSVRIVELQMLLLNWPIWYFLCWDELRNAVRMFRIDRIIKVTPTNQVFKLRKRATMIKDLDAYFESI